MTLLFIMTGSLSWSWSELHGGDFEKVIMDKSNTSEEKPEPEQASIALHQNKFEFDIYIYYTYIIDFPPNMQDN